jgi:ATP-dependent Clp protease ATP-binding subunit ClpC
MFERFTDRARRVLVLAQDEARDLEHGFLGTEHILLALVREGEGVAAVGLTQLGVQLADVRERVLARVPPGAPGTSTGAPPFTPRAKKVMELSLKAALELNHNYIGTEHLLLGLIREGEGVASQVLVSLDLTPDKIRAKVLELLSGFATPAGAGGAAVAPTTPAAGLLGTRAKSAAGGDPVGTHHYLLGLLEDPHCLAARILESLGVTKEAVAARVQEMGADGTTDELPTP